MKTIAESALSLVKKSAAEIKAGMMKSSGSITVYPESIHKLGDAVVMMARDDEKRFLVVVADCEKCMPQGFAGEVSSLSNGGGMLIGELSAANAAALRRHFPWCAPKSLRKVRTTVGCGDRLGLASYGHVLAAKQYQLNPVLAQQSMRSWS